jgi:hypothetical protein
VDTNDHRNAENIYLVAAVVWNLNRVHVWKGDCRKSSFVGHCCTRRTRDVDDHDETFPSKPRMVNFSPGFNRPKAAWMWNDSGNVPGNPKWIPYRKECVAVANLQNSRRPSFLVKSKMFGARCRPS